MKKERVSIFIDGSNFYHSTKKLKIAEKINFQKLIKELVGDRELINVYYYKDPYRLVNDGDVHELGHHFDEAIILLSVAKLNYEQNKDEGDKFFAMYKDELKVLKKTNIDKIDWLPDLRKPHESHVGNGLAHPFLSYKQISGGSFGPRVY